MADIFTPQKRSAIMAAIRSGDTSPEFVVRRLVHSLGFRFRLHVRGMPGTPDIVLARHRAVIDVRGCFWHGHECGGCRIPATRREFWAAKIARNAARDRRTTRALRRAGWRVMVVWECQTAPRKRDRLRGRIVRFLESA